MKIPLTVALLREMAELYASELSSTSIPSLYGVSDGKAVGTYVEVEFNKFIAARGYSYTQGNAAKGVDFPCVNVDLKVTSIKQPQSSTPFANARQKIYGLGHHLLVMVYEKTDNHDDKTSMLKIHHVVFIPQEETADFQTTWGVRELLERGSTVTEIDAYLLGRDIPLESGARMLLAHEIVANPPALGRITLSNALQWRVNYTRAIRQSLAEDALDTPAQDDGEVGESVSP